MRDKLLGCQLGTLVIAAGQSVSADEESAGDTVRNGTEFFIQDIDIGVGDWSSDGDV